MVKTRGLFLNDRRGAEVMLRYIFKYKIVLTC